MIVVPFSASIYLCTVATDMRKGFDGLSGIIRTDFGREPNDGSLFLFINRRRDRIKILHWTASWRVSILWVVPFVKKTIFT